MQLKIFVAVCLLCLLQGRSATGQITSQALSAAALPKNISYRGKPVQAMQYRDKTGAFLALTTQTGVQEQAGADGNRQAQLYAYVYRMNGAPALLWQLQDQVVDCPLDVVAGFVPGSFAVTDLDKNGTAEVWIAYRLSCRGDVSPSELKIIMHEGAAKYAMRGSSLIKLGHGTAPDGGTVTSNDFGKGPAAFGRHAAKLWAKYAPEMIR